MRPSAEVRRATTGSPRPDVTVCIVSWNDEADLSRCLAALPAAAEPLEAQVVVVDNGSRDSTRGLLAAHGDLDVITNAENRGITAARNQALALVRAGVVLMLDADTVPRPRSISTMVGYLRDHPQVGLVGAKLLELDGSVQPSCRTIPPPALPFLRRPPLDRWFEHGRTVDRHLLRHVDHTVPRAVDWVIGACQCYRAELLPLLGSYDERIFSHGGEDTDWCLRTWKAGFEVHYVPAAEVVHAYGHFTRKHPFSRQARRGLIDYFYMLHKHRDVRAGFAP